MQWEMPKNDYRLLSIAIWKVWTWLGMLQTKKSSIVLKNPLESNLIDHNILRTFGAHEA